jgi:hypothetical protein
MTPEIAIVLAQTLIKYGPDLALIVAGWFQSGATIDDAIAALEVAKTKTAQQYLDADKTA